MKYVNSLYSSQRGDYPELAKLVQVYITGEIHKLKLDVCLILICIYF